MPSIVYGVCAILGGTILTLQVALSFLGVDHGLDGDAHDVQHGEAEGNSFFGVLSFRTVTAALTFFGLAGLGGEQTGWSSNTTLGVAIVAAALALYGTYWLGVGLSRLEADATVNPRAAIGCEGSVYLRIPGERTGVGKVQVSQQGRTIEYEAVTSGAGLPTGESIVVVGFEGADILEVESSSRGKS